MSDRLKSEEKEIRKAQKKAEKEQKRAEKAAKKAQKAAEKETEPAENGFCEAERHADEPAAPKEKVIPPEQRRCVACGVAVPHNAHCPLCGRLIAEGVPESETYPVVADKRFLARNILRFIAIVGSAVSFFVDFLLSGTVSWSCIVAASVVCVWFCLFRPVFYARPFGTFVVADVLVVWAGSLAVDYIYGFLGWSIAYVWPSAVCAGITLVLFCSLFGRLKWSVVGSTLVIFAALCGIMIAAGYLGVPLHRKLWLILVVYDAVCIFGLRYFLSRMFGEKLEGLFHV